MGAAKTKEERYFIQCRTRSYEQRTKEGKPKPHQGHTFTKECWWLVPTHTLIRICLFKVDLLLLSGCVICIRWIIVCELTGG